MTARTSNLERDIAALASRLRAAGCVYADDEAALIMEAATDEQHLDSLVARRVAGEPLEHLVGWAAFGGLRIGVAPGVFVPRPRTEVLVDEAQARLPPSAPVVVDLCCGSGAIGLVLATRRPNVELHAADLDPVAVACAAANLRPVGATAYQGDLWAAVPSTLRGRVDLVVANVPYVPSAEVAAMPSEAREHEPRAALDGGPDGLDVLRRVAAGAPDWLVPGGYLLTETSRAQADVAARILAVAGLEPTVVAKHDVRVAVGRAGAGG
jgi:release factor glutamine methyltransferase